jgi:uncharacterized protein DUF6458
MFALPCAAMAIGTSMVLIAVGAILRYAVTVSWDAVDLQTVGVILMIVGIVGLAVSLILAVLGAARERPY